MDRLIDAQIHTYRHSDGYDTHYRHWGPSEGRDAILVLHGAMSHAGWQAPLAHALLARAPVAVIAADRRGSGLDPNGRGDAEPGDRLIDDIVELIRHLRTRFERVHLAGWCLGGQLASVAAARLVAEREITTLILIAPAFFFGERYDAVLRRATESVLEVVKDFALRVPPTRAFIPIPLRSEDFTSDLAWQRYIDADPLRVTKVTERALVAGLELAERARADFAGASGLPVLAVLAGRDRLIDTQKVEAFLRAHAADTRTLRLETLDAGHAIQFEQPDRLGDHVLTFLTAT